MARSLDQIVRDAVGNQAIEILRLTAENEALREALAEAQKPSEDAKKPSEG